MRDQAKKSTRITLERGVLEEARRLGINISKAAESGVLAAIRAERASVLHLTEDSHHSRGVS